MTDNPTNQGSFNQAGFQQERLHELFKRIDFLMPILFQPNTEINEWNYNLVFSDLNSVVANVSSKFTKEELDSINKIKLTLREIMRIKKPFEIKTTRGLEGLNKKPVANLKNQDDITDLFLLYRQNIESTMDKHGLSNPSKFNPSKSAVN